MSSPSSPTGSPAPRVMALSEEEAAWLSTRLQAAADSGLLSAAETLAADFDARRDEYFARPAHARGDARPLSDLYAVAFGEMLAREYDLQWCVVERGADAEIALHSAAAGLLLYPLGTVRRRWADPAVRPFLDLIEQTRHSLREQVN